MNPYFCFGTMINPVVILPPMLILGVLICAFGVGVLYWIRRRSFNRTTPYGTQAFRSFEAKVSTRFLERIGAWCAYLFILLGAAFIVAWLWQQDKGNIHHPVKFILIIRDGPIPTPQRPQPGVALLGPARG